MKNVSEVNYLYTSAFARQLSPEQMSLMEQVNRIEEQPEGQRDEAKLAEAKASLDKTVTPAQAADLKRQGVERIHDRMSVTLALGELIYDLYLVAVPKPVAPLKAAIHVRNLDELAQQLQKPEIDENHPTVASAIRAIAGIMIDDVAWSKVKITVTAKMASGEERALKLGSSAAGMFPTVIAEAVAAVERADARA